MRVISNESVVGAGIAKLGRYWICQIALEATLISQGCILALLWQKRLNVIAMELFNILIKVFKG